MKPYITICIYFLIFVVSYAQAGKIQHHHLKIELIPEENRLLVEDNIIFIPGDKNTWNLNENLNVSGDCFEKQSQNEASSTSEITSNLNAPNINGNLSNKVKWKSYIFLGNSLEPKQFRIKYNGKINYDIIQSSQEYSRSFSETPGIICNQGIYLSGSTGWYPKGNEKLFTFTAEIYIPNRWHVIMPGKQIKNELQGDYRITVWESSPVEEIYLVAGSWIEYVRQFPSVKAAVYLHSPDPTLANQYLNATDQYIRLYNNMIGPYPYSQFSLVENFWETGYGMPGFTLLGPKVIRFPFIIQSSYPHEILHNWWGNGVMVTPASGNWCEGLTAYLADHLLKEINNQAVEYRRATLQKYRDFVRDNQDFPLSQFTSRHSQITEAVGYGKSAMMFHELRIRLGDEIFLQIIREFYRRHLFQHASFEDWIKITNEISKKDLTRFFHERIYQTGVPELSIDNAKIRKISPHTLLQFTLRQSGTKEPYELEIPIAITYENNEVFSSKIPLAEKEKQVSLLLPETPVRIDIDPEFDVLRRLHRSEIPSSIGQIIGSSQSQIILASAESEETQKIFQNTISRWGEKISANSDKTMKIFAGISDLPQTSLWICGTNTRFSSYLKKILTLRNIQWQNKNSENLEKAAADGLTIDGQFYDLEQHSFVFTIEHPQNPEYALCWIFGGNPQSLPGLLRKLPHYGKYSYLIFRGNEPENVKKGQWPLLQSPISVTLGNMTSPTMGKLPERKSLAKLPSIFDEMRIFKQVEYLSDKKWQGRGLGTKELNEVAEYLAKEFKTIGLQPFEKQEFLQTWQQSSTSQTIALHNVIGYVPGLDSKMSQSPIFIGAHYDHLGQGIDYLGNKVALAKAGNEGKIHPGANDNASGVAVLLELARYFQQNPGKRPIYFICFTGEESGLLGSNYFVKNLPEILKKQAIAMINLDTVGRITNNTILIFGTNTAREWPFIFQGCSYTTGIPVSCLGSMDSSDHISFQQVSIPSIQIFTGADNTYHTPEDTIDRIISSDLLKVTRIAQETITYLSNRIEPLTNNIAHVTNKDNEKTAETNPTSGKIRASLGFVPDFEYIGIGVKIANIAQKNSAAEQAGLKTGDILLRIQGHEIINLANYSKILQRYQPGTIIRVVFQRNTEIHEVDITLQKR